LQLFNATHSTQASTTNFNSPFSAVLFAGVGIKCEHCKVLLNGQVKGGKFIEAIAAMAPFSSAEVKKLSATG
jgi:hypothetical protein